MFLKNVGWLQLKRCLLIVIGLSLLACQNGEGKDKQSKGANKSMKIYSMGRFSIDVPAAMKQAIQDQRIRSCDVSEFVWPTNKNKDQIRDEVFKVRLAEINNLERPEKVKKIIIEDRNIPKTGQWARGIYYYGNHNQDDEGFWDMLVDAGPVGLWIKFNGRLEAKEEMFNWVVDVAKAYQSHLPENQSTQGNRFYLQHGAINLLYRNQEHTYARFEGHPLNLKLEITMNETQEVEKAGLADKLGKILISNVTPGLDIHKIRSHKRTIAGLKGEEIILKMKEEGESTLRFGWQYQGKEDSGEYPEIDITMESPDGSLDEKIKIWDAVLDSMKPMFVRKK